MINDILDATFMILYEKNHKIIPDILGEYLSRKGVSLENYNAVTLLERIAEIGYADKNKNASASMSHHTEMFFYSINIKGIHFTENLPEDFLNIPYSYYQNIGNSNQSIPKVKWQRYKNNPVTLDWNEDIIEEYPVGHMPKNSFEYKYIRVDYLEDLENRREVTAPKIIESKIIATRRKKFASTFINWGIKHPALFIFYVAVAVFAAYLVYKFKLYPH